MERCCKAWEQHSSRLKLLITFKEHKFIALIHRDIPCSEAIQTLNALVKELFTEETSEIRSLSVEGYAIPGKYLVGDVCESGAEVEGRAVEGKKQKRHSAVPQTESHKKPKHSEEVTPAPKVKFSSLFQASVIKAEEKPSDSDSEDSVFHGEKTAKQRVNVFRKTN